MSVDVQSAPKMRQCVICDCLDDDVRPARSPALHGPSHPEAANRRRLVKCLWPRSVFATWLALGGLLSLSSPGGAQTPAAGQPLPVVASTSVIGDLVHSVGGDAIQLTTLIGPGVDAHTFDPAPGDLVTLEGAAGGFEKGVGVEPRLDQFWGLTPPPGTPRIVPEGIEPPPPRAGAATGRAQ